MPTGKAPNTEPVCCLAARVVRFSLMGVLLSFCSSAQGQDNGANSSWDARLEEASAFLYQGEFEQARDRCTLAMSLASNEEERAGTLGIRAWACIELGEYGQAISDATTLIKLKLPTMAGYVLRARAYHGNGEYERSAEDCVWMIQLDPPEREGYACRARARTAMGDFVGAIADLHRAIELGPDNVDLLVQRASVYWLKGDDTLARIDFTAAAKRCDRLRDAGEAFEHVPCGYAYLGTGDDPLAFRSFDLAASSHRRINEARCGRARVYLQMEQYWRAKEELDAAIRVFPHDGELYYWRAKAYWKMGNKDECEIDVQRALRELPQKGRLPNEAKLLLERVRGAKRLSGP